MDKIYNPHEIEQHWYKVWEDAKHFTPGNKGKPYCIMLPPPNVTGSLHMGHGFQLTLMDILIRFHRMQGDRTLWQPGTDHAGISTQLVVEKHLARQQKTRHDLGREDFIKQVWNWKESSGNQITTQLRRMGSSMDWSRERFSLDAGLSQAVQKVFISLYEEGLIYRGQRLVNWDPKLETAISDLEVISAEEAGQLWFIRYPLADSTAHLTIATTRPETMPGDTAIAVHPQDERYQHLIGQRVLLPLCDRQIPVIGDEYVDPAFASGVVKITPAHDFNDYKIGKKHRLDFINIFTSKAKLNGNVPPVYRGLDRYQARDKIIADLNAENLLEKTQDHRFNVPRGEKSGEIIEPYLTDQWFVKIEPLAKPAIEAVANGSIRFIPGTWEKTYFQWMNNIEDWCISRQLWWGHRIPAWYDQQGQVYVGYNESDVRHKYQINKEIKLHQDNDVLDTWFSSALWPFSTLGWPEKTPELQTYYPTNVLVTGFDIIFFWVARMIMMGLKFTGKVPFKEVYITGLIRDAEGKKMSKSKGNVLDPIDLIDGIDLATLLKKRTANLIHTSQVDKISQHTRKEFPDGIPAFGTDPLRFTYCALASTGRDIRFDMGRIEGYRNFCNKLWNAARYVFAHVQAEDHDFGDGPVQYSLGDQWIVSCLQHTVRQTAQHLKSYRFDLLANELYEFTWHEYCDWYLELSKCTLLSTTNTAAEKRGTRHTLLQVLETLLRLLHPIIPFITEEIWQQAAKLLGISGKSISTQPYPKADKKIINKNTEKEIQWLKEIVIAIRKIRSEMSIPPGKQVPIFLRKGNKKDYQNLEKYQALLIHLAKLKAISKLKNTEQAPISATAIAGKMEILIPLAGLIDKTAEINRLNKEISKLNKTITTCENKLNNPMFTQKAPSDVIHKEKVRLTEAKSSLTKLTDQLTLLKQV